jgi:hypothetical protein
VEKSVWDADVVGARWVLTGANDAMYGRNATLSCIANIWKERRQDVSDEQKEDRSRSGNLKKGLGSLGVITGKFASDLTQI